MIRKAKKEDSEQLAELFTQLHRHHCEIAPHKHRMPQRDFFKNVMDGLLSNRTDQPDQALLVHCGEDGGTVNAYALVKIIDVASEQKVPRKVCFIDCFAVAENARRKGIGSLLFEAVKRFGREQGCNAVQLGVDAENGGAIKFYEKMGLSPRTYILTEDI